MVSKGHFILHSKADPPLKAGKYVLEGDQKIDDGASGSYSTEAYRGHVHVRSPRYRMPPDMILSTFPPANAEGAFDSRLPQVVLKRRTLPWEREPDKKKTDLPWLALVVIAEGEGQISEEVPVADCVTPGRKLSDYADVPEGVYLSVPKTTLDKVFPTEGDLGLLAHVRQVDVDDTELAMGDDDGFLAVVMANRLPQYDHANCKPVRYLACLINVEAQIDLLPDPPDAREFFFPDDLVFRFDSKLAMATTDLDHAVMGTAEVPKLDGLAASSVGPGAVEAVEPSESPALGAPRAAATGGTGGPRLDRDWRTAPAEIEALAVSATGADAGARVRSAMLDEFRVPMEAFLAEPYYRFPVLAHWSFTSTGAGNFEVLMQELDIGMLGTVAGRPSGKPFPDCFKPSDAAAPPEPERARVAPELAESGHVGLSHLTRRGERLRAWYRGPFVPNLTRREGPGEDGRLSLAHVSDQLREMVPDGREDLGRACAFEIGRLLALSQPSIVAALMRWRNEQFGAERARRFGRFALDKSALADVVLDARNIADLGAAINRVVVTEAALHTDQLLGGTRPLINPGRTIDTLREELDVVLARGFHLELERVSTALKRGDFSVLESVAVPVAGAADGDALELRSLRQGLDSALEHLANEALPRRDRPEAGTGRPTAEAGPDEGPDALDRLLRAAARRVRQEIDR